MIACYSVNIVKFLNMLLQKNFVPLKLTMNISQITVCSFIHMYVHSYICAAVYQVLISIGITEVKAVQYG